MKTIESIDAIVMAPSIAKRVAVFLKPECVRFLGNDCFTDLNYWNNEFSGHESFESEDDVRCFVFNIILKKLFFYRR